MSKSKHYTKKVSNCNFVGVHFDAKTLGDLTQVLKASNVNIKTLLKV